MSKTILIDTSGVLFPSIFSWEMQVKMKQNNNNEDSFIWPAHCLYLISVISSLKKIGVDKDTKIIMALEGKSFRKKIYAPYKAQREGDREKHELINWNKTFDDVNKLHEQLRETTDWNFVREYDGLEADDVIAIACRYFPNDEKIVVSGDCLSGTTKVRMAQGGSKLLRNIKINDKVLSYNEKKKKFVSGVVVEKHKRLHNQECLIYYEKNKTPIRSSLNHKFLTKKGWTKAKDLTHKDILYHLNQNPFPYNNLQNNYKLGYLLGLAVGDGHINSKENSISYEMCDLEPLKRVKQYVKDLFHYEAKIKKIKITVGGKQAYRIRLYLNYHFEYLLKYQNKPTDYYRKGYCAGFFDAEGSKNESKSGIQLSFYQNGTEQLKLLQNYLDSMNIKSSEIFKSCGYCNKFTLTNNDAISFYQHCKPAIKRKYPNWKYHYGFLQNGKKIKKIEIINKPANRPFFHYDLTIQGHHTYVIEGNIIVHNCDLKQLTHYPNTYFYNLFKKCKGSKGMFEDIKDPLKIIADKARKGDVSDNIIPSPDDEDEDFALRYKLVNLLELPKEIEERGINAIDKELKREKNIDINGLPTYIQERFPQIYNEKYRITPQYCFDLQYKRDSKKKKEKYIKDKIKKGLSDNEAIQKWKEYELKQKEKMEK